MKPTQPRPNFIQRLTWRIYELNAWLSAKGMGIKADREAKKELKDISNVIKKMQSKKEDN